MRTPVSISDYVAVCDDGSVWRYLGIPKKWEELPPIPDTPRDFHARRLVELEVIAADRESREPQVD